jgi:proteic killer suppression protein
MAHANLSPVQFMDATSLNDLAALPGNRLEALRGDREGQHSIRINDQYRICFESREQGHASPRDLIS